METNIQSHLRLVHWLAHKYRWAGASHEDLVSAGMEGLSIAADRFDPSRSVKFVTYAHWWVRAYIQKAVSSHIKHNHTSLEDTNNIGRSGHERVADEYEADTQVDMTPIILRLLAALPESEQLIISRRFGIDTVIEGNREELLKESRSELQKLKI